MASALRPECAYECQSVPCTCLGALEQTMSAAAVRLLEASRALDALQGARLPREQRELVSAAAVTIVDVRRMLLDRKT